jgi:colicin import membrane protein
VWGVHWKTESSDAVEAELWAAVPQAAAPPPTTEVPPEKPPEPTPVPTPPPPPPPVATPEAQVQPDIATEQEKKLKEQQRQKEQQDALKEKQRLEDQKKADLLKQQQDKQKALEQQKAEDARLKKEHDANVARMLGGIDAPPNATGTARKSAGPSAGYAGRIQARIRPNIRPIKAFDASLATDIELQLGPTGNILNFHVVHSSGDPAWDQEALKAVDRTGVLPRDIDGTVPPTMIVTIKPES